MARLRALLSRQDAPPSLTVRDIRHRYALWKSSAVLNDLRSDDMSSLIRLLGTLSVSEYGKPPHIPHSHPHALHMPKTNFAPHWEFIERIGHDKRWLRYPLLPSDHYWLMRAALARYTAQTDRTNAEQILNRARRHFHALCGKTTNADVYLPYFHALLIAPTTSTVDELIACFARLLMEGVHVDVHTVETFFRALLHPASGISATSRELFLRALARGLQSHTDASERRSGHIKLQQHRDVQTLVVALDNAVFGGSRVVSHADGTALDHRISQWSTEVARRVFAIAPDSIDTVNLRWNCLVLLALARMRSASGKGHSVAPSRDPVQQAAIVEWQTVCILTSMDTLVSSSEFTAQSIDKTVLHGLSQVVRRVWRDWTTLSSSVSPPRPPLVKRIISASFFKIAGLLKDRALVDACREFCIEEELWSFRESAPATAEGLHSLAVEQLHASLTCGIFFERALVDLMMYTTSMSMLRGPVDASITRLSRVDPEQALELITLATSRGVVPTAEVVAAVGATLAERGISNYLDRFLTNARLSPDLRVKVALAHLQMYLRYGRRFMDPDQLVAVADELFALAATLEEPKALFVNLRSSLLLLIRHQRAAQAVRLVEDLPSRYPTAFPEAFYTRLLYALLQHRQFRLALRTLMRCLPLYPEMAQRWTPLVLSRCIRAGARRLVSKLSRRTGTRHPMEAYRAVPARRRVLELLHGLNPQPGASPYATDPHQWRHTVHMLVRAQRLHTAERFFQAVHARAPARVRTSLGNAILHGYLLRRRTSNRQRLRRVMDAYGLFRREYRFAPDHVTVNILLKAHLRSVADVDGPCARRLFDVLVRSGYPTGVVATGDDGGRPPFGTKSGPVGSVVLGQLEIPRVNRPLEFRRHVQPLYKMFVKAFYDRRDVVAARKVVGILKVLESQIASGVRASTGRADRE
ncbi:hypothetical protein C8Q76DRAFT_800739 [Earliella scabrosa]|nr:hypothetical protein C8Q76DRAFT_800739 [Earliella scabrosa]